jgi:hypothetical protein
VLSVVPVGPAPGVQALGESATFDVGVVRVFDVRSSNGVVVSVTLHHPFRPDLLHVHDREGQEYGVKYVKIHLSVKHSLYRAGIRIFENGFVPHVLNFGDYNNSLNIASD